MSTIPFILQNNTYIVSKDYNQINLPLLYNKILFLNPQKVPLVVNACSYSKEGGLYILSQCPSWIQVEIFPVKIWPVKLLPAEKCLNISLYWYILYNLAHPNWNVE